ncbi:MAG: alpha/beta hydrolase [Chthoniobacterales bacterium]
MSVPQFHHRFVAGRSGRTLLLLHGTGSDETDLLSLGQTVDPDAALLSPRGQVLENGMPRFFRRLAEGVFDEEDVKRRADELADFIDDAASLYQFDQSKLIAVGYSNGANIASAILLLRPGTFHGAALLRAMVPFVPEQLPDLGGAPVLISSGEHDPIIPLENAQRLAALLRRAGAEVQTEVEDAGHNLTPETVATTSAWLTALAR